MRRRASLTDICMLVYGDNLPGGESFIESAMGDRFSLDANVRIGTPAIYLHRLNEKRPPP